MGEHGDSSMVPFSAVTVGGVPFDRLGLDKTAILTQTRQAGMDIIEGKGSTEFGIGLSLAQLAALCEPPVTKSSLSHRLRKLIQLSAQDTAP